jgi:hypothetical protein
MEGMLSTATATASVSLENEAVLEMGSDGALPGGGVLIRLKQA